MAITRAQAQGLLNTAEMQLYDESRINGLRKLDASALQKRVERARKARDRARDLVKRHKLAMRDTTGSKGGRAGGANQRSKDKAELLSDILKRFEGALKMANKPAAKKVAKKSSAKKTTPAVRASTKGTPRSLSRLELRREAEQATPHASKAASKQTAAKKKARAVAAKKKLLDQKNARDRAPKPWQSLDAADPSAVAPPTPQTTASATSKAKRLHAGQSRMKPIQGSISSRVRRNQARRDGR